MMWLALLLPFSMAQEANEICDPLEESLWAPPETSLLEDSTAEHAFERSLTLVATPLPGELPPALRDVNQRLGHEDVAVHETQASLTATPVTGLAGLAGGAMPWSWLFGAGAFGAGAVAFRKKKAMDSVEDGPAMRVLGRTNLGANNSVVLVEVRDEHGQWRRLVLGTGQSGPTLVADLTPTPVATEPHHQQPRSFAQHLAEQGTHASPPVAHAPAPTAPQPRSEPRWVVFPEPEPAPEPEAALPSVEAQWTEPEVEQPAAAPEDTQWSPEGFGVFDSPKTEPTLAVSSFDQTGWPQVDPTPAPATEERPSGLGALGRSTHTTSSAEVKRRFAPKTSSAGRRPIRPVETRDEERARLTETREPVLAGGAGSDSQRTRSVEEARAMIRELVAARRGRGK